ncbi:Haem peroxidase domain superfamily, animal type [Sergentomyia squamirostris]
MRDIRELYQTARRNEALQEQYNRQLYDLGMVMQPSDIGQSNLNNVEPPFSPTIMGAFRQARILGRTAQFLHQAFYANFTKNDFPVEAFYSWLYDFSPYIPNIPDTARWRLDCDPFAPYRSINGTCNNLFNPNLGSSFTPFPRITYPLYDDDINIVRRSQDHSSLPPSRNLVVYFFRNQSIFEHYHSQLNFKEMPNQASLFFAQMLAHDITQKANTQNLNGEKGIQCCAKGNSRIPPASQLYPACIPLEISPRDPDYAEKSIECITVIRSEIIASFGKTLSAAEQANRATSFLDLSPSYGHTNAIAQGLRAYTGGKFALDEDNILPRVDNCTSKACYKAGDSRVNQTPFLAVMQSIFYRHHNRVAMMLSTLNPHWDDERCYQETRRIVIAQYQHIIYTEFLPAFFGPSVVNEFNEEYSSSVKSATTNEFAASTLRNFHIFLANDYVLADRNDNLEILTLSDTVFNSSIIITKYDDILRGLCRQRINLEGAPREITSRLFKNSKNDLGTDLLSFDIQRGRDHGLNSYTTYLEYCGHKHIHDFDDLAVVMDYETIRKLKKAYKSVHDIDFFVGSSLEDTRGELFGPTNRCIMIEQFKRYKSGDRFFYTFTDGPNPFTPQQLKEIKKFTAAHIFCENSGVESVPRRSFITPMSESDFIACKNLPKIQYSLWRESQFNLHINKFPLYK